MKILFLGEYNIGGGAKSNLNLAFTVSQFANVGFLGIDTFNIEHSAITFFRANARKSMTLTYVQDFTKALQNFKPDIVHATGMYTGLLSLAIKFLLRRKYKVIITLRHTSTNFRYKQIAKYLIRFLNQADYIHYLTSYQKAIYEPYGLSPKKFMIIPNIVKNPKLKTSDILAIRKKLLHLTVSKYLIVFAGRIVESKQLDIFIKCIHYLRSKNLEVGGVIIGAGDENYISQLNNLVNNLSLNNNIYFSGYLNNPELFVTGSDFGLFPTQSESLPRFIVESFSLGKTMVVSNHPSIANVVRKDFDVLLAIEHTPEAYADQCLKIVTNNALKLHLENGAMDSYKTRFNPQTVTDQYKMLYSKVLID